MANDLPVRLAQPLRGRFSTAPIHGVMLLFPRSELVAARSRIGMWVSGAGRADIIVRAALPDSAPGQFEAESPIRTVTDD